MTKVESYRKNGTHLIRRVELRNGNYHESIVVGDTHSNLSICPEDYDLAWLRSCQKPIEPIWKKEIRLVDLFSGTGPMTLGVIEAGRAVGIKVTPIFAIDFDKNAALNYAYNFPNCSVINDDILKYVDGEIGSPSTQAEEKTLKLVGHIDMVIGGPPCQGHSDLNNYTRRNDPRNQLIFRVVRFAELTRPRFIIIENVQGIRHDKNHILQSAEEYLESFGYQIHEQLIMASQFGVAQNRRRFFLIASLDNLEFDLQLYMREKVNGVWWAINDLLAKNGNDVFNTSAKHSSVNQQRINYLFENNIYELPYQLRPKCQQKEDNRYTSVYSRMHPDLPAPTITSGFGSIGQGRFGHPYERRTLTPHEAARVQFIPDFFCFSKELTRVALQTMIGNAVPPKLTYIIGLELFR